MRINEKLPITNSAKRGNSGNSGALNRAALDAFEAQARSDGVIDDSGFFVQDNYEFELEALSYEFRRPFADLVSDGDTNPDTVDFFRDYLSNFRDIKFTPFD